MARRVPESVERTVPRALRTRVNQAFTRLKAPVYVTQTARGGDERVLCKVCGEPIAGLVVHDQPVSITRGDGKVVIRERLVWAQFSNYAVVELVFTDTSRHQTPLCTDCAGRLTTEQAQDAYAADVQDLLERPGAERVDWARWHKAVQSWRRVD